MYKLLINAKDVRNRKESPFRKLVELPFREIEFKENSPLLKQNPRKVSQLVGDVHLFKCKTEGAKDHSQQVCLNLQTALQIKTQIVFVSDVSEVQYKDILAHLEQRMDHIQLIQTITKVETHSDELMCLVVYFRSIAISEQFYNMLSESYHQLAFYIKEVTLVKSTQEEGHLWEIFMIINEQISNQAKISSFNQQEDINIYKQKWIEIPRCMACLQKLEYELTGLSPSVLMNKIILEPSHCKTCLTINRKAKQIHETCCEECSSPEDNWICMVCNRVGCGRYKNADAFKHFQKTGHIISMDLQTQRVWNYLSDCFCHRVIPLQKQEITLKFPDPTSSKGTSRNEQSLEGAFWQYCSVVSEQLQRQRNFYQKIKTEEKERYDRQTVKANKTIVELEKELADKSQTIKKQSKKNRKMEKRAAEIKAKIKDDRQLLGQYQMRIKQETKEMTMAELDIANPKIQEKLNILRGVQSEIDSILIKLSE